MFCLNTTEEITKQSLSVVGAVNVIALCDLIAFHGTESTMASLWYYIILLQQPLVAHLHSMSFSCDVFAHLNVEIY